MNIHSVSLKGLRNQNEDCHEIILNRDNKNCNIKNVDFFSIYDGHGGKLVSSYVKNNLSKLLLNKKVQYPLSKRDVVSIYDSMQTNLKTQSFSHHMGSTGLVMVRFKNNGEDFLNIINNGDSRCILCRDNFAMPLTKDHKPSWPEEHHRIVQMGGKPHFDGYDWRIKELSVSRAFGDVDATPYVTHRPDLYRYKLDKSDKFIVMACDGLWDVMTNSEVVNFVLMSCFDSTTKSRKKCNFNIAKKLAEHALTKGSTDNITAIVAFLQ